MHNQDNDTLKDLLKANVERPIRMTVYNSKSQSLRDVQIVPSAIWGGQGLLGISIRFCSFQGANENVWHVLDVEPNSPAEQAGLRSDIDFVIGSDSLLHEAEDFFTLVETHEGKPLKLYVYSTDTDSCREVTITPNRSWGGQGSLGCGIGYGYLHRIPTRLTHPPVVAGEDVLASSLAKSAVISDSPIVQPTEIPTPALVSTGVPTVPSPPVITDPYPSGPLFYETKPNAEILNLVCPISLPSLLPSF
ncbi:GORASP1 [Cordylochernes scorpioides]|uniref:GORASP1 n=1 Tax=Cordylochernes scorpioides TaxID=51811 RepID=A0ABY6KPL2_9ARAC|nr:GORASP1 [Cordylochernes scorpioides]